MISRLFIFEFFQGAAIATYFFSAMTLFVHRLPATELPKVFILSSFLLWFFGFIYSQLEHRLRTKQLIYFVLIFNALIIVLFRIFIDLHEGEWFLYIFLASFNILYLLNNLEFWGLVALLFDVRQSKRLFAIVSAWDGPARLTGYAVSGAFVIINGKNDIVTSKDLLIIASLFMLAALIFFIPMARSKEMRNIAPVDHHHYATQTLQHIQASLTGSKLIRNAAFVSFFSFCFYLVTNFVLYGYIKKDIDNDKSLDLFFSVFLIVSRGLTLIVKPLFINRLLDKIGLRKSMLISPVTFAILSAVAIVFSFQSTKTGFYLFLIMAVSIDIMRSAIQSPVLLATLQPLPTQQRLRGHTIIKGLMDPFAFLASGILLLSITTTGQDINLSLLSWVLFSIAIVWIFFAFSVDSNYLKMLTAAVQKRILNERDISITDVNSLNFLLNRIEKGNEEEVLAVLNVVASQPVNREKFFIKALHHKSAKIKQQALRYIQIQQCFGCLPELKKMLDEESVLPVLPQLLLTIAVLDKNEDLSAYFNHENRDVSNAAVMAWLSQEDQERRRIAEDHVRKLFESGQLKEITNALR
ncbi:MAG TPA: MFS transporter, partial [Puia sp.]|nr:MFS transporter [Puia sp.]